MENTILKKIGPIKLQGVYNSNDEIEKHYILKSNTQEKFDKVMLTIIRKLGLNQPMNEEDIDVYYDEDDILRMYNITVRKRTIDGKFIYTLKYEINNDELLKRKEVNFESIEEVTEFLRTEFNIPINNLKEVITLNTSKIKYNLKFNNSIIEVSFDTTIPIYNGVTLDKNYMIELELKKGNVIGLMLLDRIIEGENDLEESYLSKKEITMKQKSDKFKEDPFDISGEKAKEAHRERISNIFTNIPESLRKRQLLEEKKYEIKRLKETHGGLTKPIVITLAGTPHAGKTTCIDCLFELLKETNLKTVYLAEPVWMIYQTLKTNEEKKQLLSDRIGFVNKQYDIGKQSVEQKVNGNDIILCDRGFFDPFIWYNMYYKLGIVDKEKYCDFLKHLKESYSYLNYLYLLYTSSDEAIRRKYVNSLTIEPRMTMSPTNIGHYNQSMLSLQSDFSTNLDYTKLIDTTIRDKMYAPTLIAEEVLDNVIELYKRRK